MKQGNYCWKGGQRDFIDFEQKSPFLKSPPRGIITRVNRELTIFNTIRIIKKYKPKIYIIENPAFGRIWEYIDKILGFNIPYPNLTYYNNYGFGYKKPTKFGSSIFLDLKMENKPGKVRLNHLHLDHSAKSNIPLSLLEDVLKVALMELKKPKGIRK